MENAPSIRWKFPDLLLQEGISVYRLNQEIGKQVGRTTLYAWSQEAPKRVDTAVLAWVLWGLQQITGRRFEVGDLIEYRD
jgi:hypothetical protein